MRHIFLIVSGYMAEATKKFIQLVTGGLSGTRMIAFGENFRKVQTTFGKSLHF